MQGVLSAGSVPEAQQSSQSGLYSRMWHYARGSRLQYTFAMALLAVAQSIKLCVPWLAAQAINTVQLSGAGRMSHAGMLIAAILGIYAASWAIQAPARILERNVGIGVRRAMAESLFAKLSCLPLTWHESHHSGELQHRVHQASAALSDFTQNQFIYMQLAVSVVGPLIALYLLSGVIGTLALAGYIVIALAVLRFDRVLMRLALDENQAERRYAAAMLDFLGNICTVLSLRLQHAVQRLLSGRMTAVFSPLRKSIALNEAKWCTVELFSVGLTWALVAAYAWHAQRAGTAGATLLLGSAFMVYQYAQQAGTVIGSMASNFQNFARIRADYAAADLIWNAEERSQVSQPISAQWHEISARGLSFSYPRRDGGGVHDIAIALRRGERLALIGPSGAGKSTLLRLIAGLYDPRHGHYQIDGTHGFGVRNLGSIATLIPQETEVFEASVLDNLTFGIRYTSAALRMAVQASAFDAVIGTLPNGWDTLISERGFNLSGGQRQRLALARGFLLARSPEVGVPSSLLLLDEPTSALDQVTEARIFQRMRECWPDASVIASVHRLSLLTCFDRVVLMQDGRVIDCGTVKELLARQLLMRQMMGGGDQNQQAVRAAV